MLGEKLLRLEFHQVHSGAVLRRSETVRESFWEPSQMASVATTRVERAA
jgi:hypothetical protein